MRVMDAHVNPVASAYTDDQNSIFFRYFFAPVNIGSLKTFIFLKCASPRPDAMQLLSVYQTRPAPFQLRCTTAVGCALTLLHACSHAYLFSTSHTKCRPRAASIWLVPRRRLDGVR
jgi:hypothetical protein